MALYQIQAIVKRLFPRSFAEGLSKPLALAFADRQLKAAKPWILDAFMRNVEALPIPTRSRILGLAMHDNADSFVAKFLPPDEIIQGKLAARLEKGKMPKIMDIWQTTTWGAIKPRDIDFFDKNLKKLATPEQKNMRVAQDLSYLDLLHEGGIDALNERIGRDLEGLHKVLNNQTEAEALCLRLNDLIGRAIHLYPMRARGLEVELSKTANSELVRQCSVSLPDTLLLPLPYRKDVDGAMAFSFEWDYETKKPMVTFSLSRPSRPDFIVKRPLNDIVSIHLAEDSPTQSWIEHYLSFRDFATSPRWEPRHDDWQWLGSTNSSQVLEARDQMLYSEYSISEFKISPELVMTRHTETFEGAEIVRRLARIPTY